MTRRDQCQRTFGCAAALLAVLSIAAGLAGCRSKPAPPERPAPLVVVAPAIAQDVPLYIDEIGSCTAREVVAIQPQASGQIVGIHFTDGQDVRKGDLLFTIDPRPYQAALDQAKAGLAQNQASLDLAKLNFARATILLPTNAISQQDYDTQRNAVAVSEAQVQTSQAQIETARVNLDYTTIVSPINGRAGKRQVDLGNIVTANSGTTLLTIQRMDPIYADFIIPEQQLTAVREKMASGELKTLVRLGNEPQSAARAGGLTFLDNAVQTATGTVSLRATMPNADRHFWPGQFVQVRLVLGVLKGAVLVPSRATLLSQKGPYVYVVQPGQTVDLRQVTLGQLQGSMVVITSGLSAGEQVVVDGQLTVAPGRPVRVQNAQPETASAPASNPATAAAPTTATAPARDLRQ